MNSKMILYMLGKIMILIGIVMLLPIITAIVYGENILWFVYPAIALLVLGWLFSHKRCENTHIYAKEGFLIVALTWIVTSLFGSLPFIISGYIPSFIDALF